MILRRVRWESRPMIMESAGVLWQAEGWRSRLAKGGPAQTEGALGRFDLMEEEASSLVIDDVNEGAKPKWMLAGKLLYQNMGNIQTFASALWPAWGT